MSALGYFPSPFFAKKDVLHRIRHLQWMLSILAAGDCWTKNVPVGWWA